jgi:hypothetical protein
MLLHFKSEDEIAVVREESERTTFQEGTKVTNSKESGQNFSVKSCTVGFGRRQLLLSVESPTFPRGVQCTDTVVLWTLLLDQFSKLMPRTNWRPPVSWSRTLASVLSELTKYTTKDILLVLIALSHGKLKHFLSGCLAHFDPIRRNWLPSIILLICFVDVVYRI